MRITPTSPAHARARTRAGIALSLLAATAAGSCSSSKHAALAPAAMDMGAPTPMRDADGIADMNDAENEQRVAMVQPEPAVMRLEARPMDGERAREQAGEWAAVREFPVPDYSAGDHDGPRNDFRETVYFAPSVHTDARGQAQVSFFLSDAITSFRATAEGIAQPGMPGRGDALLASRLPVSLAAKLPLEVSYGDVVSIPVTVENTTARSLRARVSADFGPAFRIRGTAAPRTATLAAGRSDTVFYQLEVVGRGREPADGRVSLGVEAGGLTDRLERVVRVSPGGYPGERTLAGTLGKNPARHTLVLPAMVEDTLSASLRLYPSPVATMVQGTEALIREPTGCFEQASSANYPNVMVMRYLAENNALESALVARTERTLDSGYKRLTGYESQERGFEWFGQNPGHEALTAYGLMQFAEMEKVYPGLDKTMVERTRTWLEARRDGQGGYRRNDRALDTFGRASQEVTDAYITYALARTGSRGLDKELARAREQAARSSDPYVLALSAGALLAANALDPDGASALARLASLQATDGRFAGARESITRSGGISLDIETTALAALAMMRSPEIKTRHAPAVRKATDWITGQRQGGGFGATQSTILAMEALTEYSRVLGGAMPGARVTVLVNGETAAEVALDDSGRDGIELPGLERVLVPGENTVELVATLGDQSQELSLPYDLTAHYRVAAEASSAESAVTLGTTLSKRTTRMGQAVRLSATITNRRNEGIPMVIARLGIPGGLTYQVWQLDELRDRGVIDFYETREREVIVYFRAMAPRQVKKVDIELLASVPGTYESPESTAYLYYTDEYRHYAPPTRIRIKEPWRPSAKKPAAKPQPTTPPKAN